MKTVGEFKKAGVVFVKGDECQEQPSGRIYRNDWFGENSQKQFTNDTVTSFAWRDLTTKPDNPQYKIELDIANHRWRPSLNQGAEYPDEQRVTEFKCNPASTVAVNNDKITLLQVMLKASEVVESPGFKVGDLVEVEHCAIGKYLLKIKYIDTVSLFGYLQSDDNQPPRMDQFCAYMKDITIKPYNPRLNELKDIIGLHDDPTECAKAILAAGYTK